MRTLSVITLTAALTLGSVAPAAASVNSTINRWLAASPYAGRHTSLLVWDRTSGRFLAGHNASRELRPASNMKLLTTAAALDRFGVGDHLSTQVMATGTLSGGTLHGNLWLVGGGDPSLSTNTFSHNAWGGVSGRLSDLAAALRAVGIQRVTGRLYGDAGLFDSRRTAPFWKPSYWKDCPPLSALSVNESLFRFGRPEASPDPALYAAQLMVHSLKARGVLFAHGPATGNHPASARQVAVELSPAVTRLLRQMDEVSDNYYAETLTKGLAVHGGLAGTTANGVRAIRNAVSGLGVPLTRARIYDGSGLSLGDRLSAAGVLLVLRRAGDHAWGWYFRHALPVAGVSGTLQHRMLSGPAHGNVVAKTGSLSDASALSGYLTTANGHRVLFSIIINHPAINAGRAHAIQDRICQYLAASRP
ncbi:MAG: D-alanyl-D-alanine carboxypeptidase/D-alanyl-D-alanine endopeptidase [Gaiellales bacterium]